MFYVMAVLDSKGAEFLCYMPKVSQNCPKNEAALLSQNLIRPCLKNVGVQDIPTEFWYLLNWPCKSIP